MSKIIRASQIRQEEKLRELFSEQLEELQGREIERARASEQVSIAHSEAAALLEQAKQEAGLFIARAQDEAQKVMEEGYKEGYQKGYEEGFQAGVEQLIQEMGKFFQNFEREMEHTQMVMNSEVQGMAPRLIQLSAQIASKIIRREVQFDSMIIVNQVEQILREISRVKSLAIRVNPSELAAVKAYEDQFLQLTQGIDSIEFVIDHSLEPGGCIVETDSGGVDATIETQLQMITAKLLEGNRDVK